jgi:hypothetical protein
VFLGALLVATGCGSPAEPGGTGGATTSAGATAFPVTLTRSGGVAGFRDRLTVSADGHVTGTTRAGAVDCRTDPSVASTLAAALASAGAASRSGSDQLVVTLSGGGRQLSLGEASGADAAARAATELLNAVQQPPAAGGRCHAG